MTSTIKVNTITTESGSTLTLGESGKTVTLASGATQSGFGRTGTVDWQTGSIKTSTFTAVSGQGFFCDTNGGAFTCNLPAGSAGAIVSLQDYRNTFDTASLTVRPNGSEKINTGAGPVILSTEGEGITLVYIDSTVGWRSIQDNDFADPGSNFIIASGGTETESGNCKIHTFTGPGTFTVSTLAACSADNQISYMIVAGGGAGSTGSSQPTSYGGGGGGAGGFRETKSPVTSYTASPLDGQPSAPNRVTVTATSFPIVVGAGGTTQTYQPTCTPGPTSAMDGSVSSGFGISSAGGGGGGQGNNSSPHAGRSGGSGGGSGGRTPPNGGGAGAGNTPPTTPAQGNSGGTGTCSGATSGGGGGGATATGTAGTPPGISGVGGAGASTEISGSAVTRAGGGGAGGGYPGGAGNASGGTGGAGGGGAGNAANSPSTGGVAGTTNTGGGGGGGGSIYDNANAKSGGNGGSGIVIIRYKFK